MTSGGGYSIGFKELYDLVTELGRKLDTMSSLHSQQIAANAERLETHSKAMKMMWQKIDESKRAGWQVNLAIATSLVALVASVIPVLVK